MKDNSLKKITLTELPFFLSLPAFVWQILFFYIPVTLIIVLSFVKIVDSSFSSFTLAYYLPFLDILYVKIIFRSLLLAFFSAFICLFISYPIAYFLALRVKRLRNLFLFFLILPFWTSLLVQVYAWFFVLERHGLINNILMYFGLISEPLLLLNNAFAVYLVMIYCYLPFMILPLYTILEKMDRQLLEASYDLGATGWQTFKKVTLPFSFPGIKTGFFLVFVPAFGEFVIPALMGGARTFYVGSLIAHYFLSAQSPSLGAAFTCIASIVLIIVVLSLHYVFKQLIRVKR